MVRLCLSQCSDPVATQELALGLPDTVHGVQRLAFEFAGAQEVGQSRVDISQSEV